MLHLCLKPFRSTTCAQLVVLKQATPALKFRELVAIVAAHDGDAREHAHVAAAAALRAQLPLPRAQERPRGACGHDEEALVALAVDVDLRRSKRAFDVHLQAQRCCEQHSTKKRSRGISGLSRVRGLVIRGTYAFP